MFQRVLIPFFTLTLICTQPARGHGQETLEARSAPTISAIDAAMQKFVDGSEISGAVTLVAHKGKVVHLGAVELSNIDSKTAMQPPRRVTRISSSSAFSGSSRWHRTTWTIAMSNVPSSNGNSQMSPG